MKAYRVSQFWEEEYQYFARERAKLKAQRLIQPVQPVFSAEQSPAFDVQLSDLGKEKAKESA